MRNIDITKYFLPTFQPLVFDKHFMKLLFGGRGGGKSVNGAARKIIFRMMTDGRISSVVLRKNEKDHLNSTFEELKKAITAFGQLIYDTAYEEEIQNGKSEEETKRIANKEKNDFLSLWKYNTSPLKITYLPCGNKIVFKGFNDPVSIKSITSDSGYFCIIWVEEGEAVESEVDFDDAIDSFRGKLPDGLTLEVIITFNSPYNTHWLKARADDAHIKINFPVHKFINEYYPDYTYPSISSEKGTDVDTIAHYSVYTENPMLSDLDRRRYEKTALSNPSFYKHKYLGEFGSKTGNVFDNWVIEDFNIQEIIHQENWREKTKWQILGGLDLGFVHPTAFGMYAINKEDRLCYIFDGFILPGMKNSEIAGKIISMGYGREKIISENAEPRTLIELKDYGLHHLKPVKKYRGDENSSIMQGIKIMKEYKIVIHKRLKDFIRDFSNYVWDEDKYGNALERPIDIGDDGVACTRYPIMWVEKPKWGFGGSLVKGNFSNLLQ